MLFFRKTLGTVLLVTLFHSLTYSQSIERVEPPFWWRDMNNPELQLLVYGEDIGTTQPVLNSPHATIDMVHRPPNANYLFIDLTIAAGTSAEVLDIDFKSPDGSETRYSYELKQRRPNSANRQGFSSADAMYLLMPDRFANGDVSNDVVDGLREGYDREHEGGRHGGDIAGIEQHLDYVKDMGFTAVWINPLLENDQDSFSYHGYATTDYYKVDPRYGTNEDYVNMSKAASDAGLKVIMDIIVNHCGSRHWWMEDPPMQDWIHYYDEEYVQTNHRKTTLNDPYVAQEDRDAMVKGWFVPVMPDLNQKNPYMSTYLIQNSIWWIEYADLGGIRQDTYSYPYRKFMTDWTCAIMDEYPNFNIVGEEWVLDAPTIAYWQRGKVNHDGYTACLPSVMDFPMTVTLHTALNENDSTWGNGLIKLYENLGKDYLYADPYNLVIFPDNHDMSRILTQVKEEAALAKMAVAYILTIRGIPQLFYGTEILMSNEGTDSHGVIRSDFPGGWEGDAVNAFTGDGLTDAQREMKAYTRKLLMWRRDNPVIHTGKLLHYEPQNGTYCYFRYDDNDKVMVVMNKNKEDVELEVDRFASMLEGYSSATDIISEERQSIDKSLTIPARSTTVFHLSK